jgi:hypothetical protein
MLRSVASNHARLYRELKARHPGLFANLDKYRRDSLLSPLEQRLYPVIYGGRRPFGIKRRAAHVIGRIRLALSRGRGS